MALKLPSDQVVVKAQVLAGGRGKGRFHPNGYQGGVHLVAKQDVQAVADKMIGQTLITKQTGHVGKPCDTVLIQQKMELSKELYLALLLNREFGGPAIVCSPKGGMDIEEVAATEPDQIFTFPVPIKTGVTDELTARIANSLGLAGDQAAQLNTMLKSMYQCFLESDLVQLEINPLGVTKQGQVLVCDAKLNFDENASFRQKAVYTTRDLRQENQYELEAQKYDLSYIGMDGNIGCLVNGAGLAMATMDLIKLMGGEPANFLDVGGGAQEDQIIQALRILENNSKVDAILINIFGGIMRCDIIASGLVNAVRKIEMKKPIVARLVGTNWEKARSIIRQSGVPVITTSEEEEAVRRVVGIAEILRLAREIEIEVQFSSIREIS